MTGAQEVSTQCLITRDQDETCSHSCCKYPLCVRKQRLVWGDRESAPVSEKPNPGTYPTAKGGKITVVLDVRFFLSPCSFAPHSCVPTRLSVLGAAPCGQSCAVSIFVFIQGAQVYSPVGNVERWGHLGRWGKVAGPWVIIGSVSFSPMQSSGCSRGRAVVKGASLAAPVLAVCS